MKYCDKAKALFNDGANCAQAVFTAFADKMGIDEKTAMKLASSFGGGMGRMREVCGACSGMFMVTGMLKGYDDIKDNNAKMEHYKLIQELAKSFKEENGSIICRELLEGVDGKDTSFVPSERTEKYYKKRPCAEYVYDAAKIIEEYLENN